MKKIVTSNKNVHGKSVTLPTVGLVPVSTEGIVEVDDATADMLVDNTEHWSHVDESGKAKPAKPAVKSAASTEKTDEGDEGNAGGTTEMSDEQLQAIRTDLKDKLSLNDMTEIAQAYEVSEEDIKKFGKNKSLMINFLIGKIGVEKIQAALAK